MKVIYIILSPLFLLALGTLVYHIDYWVLSYIWWDANHRQIDFFALPLAILSTIVIICYLTLPIRESEKGE